VDWTLVSAERITHLLGGSLTSIVLHADRPEGEGDGDNDDSAALIRTLRPIQKVWMWVLRESSFLPSFLLYNTVVSAM